MTDPTREGARATWRDELPFLRRVLIVAGVVVLLLLLWAIRGSLLLAFGGVVVASVLLALADPLERRFGLSRTLSLMLVGGGVLVALVLIGTLIGQQVQAQVSQLGQQLPAAIQGLEQRLGIPLAGLGGGGQPGGGGGESGLASMAPAGFLQQVGSFGRIAVDAVASVALAVVGGVFIAASPRLYRRGLVKLLPKGQHARAEEALDNSGRALRQWLLAALLAMTIVGTLAGLGSWALGLPAPLALALFAGLAEFVPLVGSVVGAVPALLLALGHGSSTFLWTLALFLAIQQIESNIITPLVTQRMVQIPPAVVLFSVVAFGAVFGLPGVVLAAPLTVVAYVLVKKLYVRETLGERTDVPGEPEGKGE
ncbi:MAG TPA: AI-2E family transporter [Roseomonas sp.]|jgi:predicted PurR-regulated permease PerM